MWRAANLDQVSYLKLHKQKAIDGLGNLSSTKDDEDENLSGLQGWILFVDGRRRRRLRLESWKRPLLFRRLRCRWCFCARFRFWVFRQVRKQCCNPVVDGKSRRSCFDSCRQCSCCSCGRGCCCRSWNFQGRRSQRDRGFCRWEVDHAQRRRGRFGRTELLQSVFKSFALETAAERKRTRHD